MFFNYKIKDDCKKAQDFLLVSRYDNVYNKLPEEHILKYIHKNTGRMLFTVSLLPPLKPGDKVLEIGAVPYCFSTILMESFSCEVTSIDLPQTIFPGEPYTIKKEDIEVPNSMTHKKYRITSWTCNAEKDTYPFKDNTFDVVICTEVLEHLLYSPTHVFKESRRVLKDNGLMLVSTVNSLHFKRMADIILNENIDDVYSPLGPYGRHNRNYTRKELIKLAQNADFKISFVSSATLRGTRFRQNAVANTEDKIGGKPKENKFLKKIRKLLRKTFLNLTKCIIHLPLPGMKDKRHYNIFLLLKK